MQLLLVSIQFRQKHKPAYSTVRHKELITLSLDHDHHGMMDNDDLMAGKERVLRAKLKMVVLPRLRLGQPTLV